MEVGHDFFCLKQFKSKKFGVNINLASWSDSDTISCSCKYGNNDHTHWAGLRDFV